LWLNRGIAGGVRLLRSLRSHSLLFSVENRTAAATVATVAAAAAGKSMERSDVSQRRVT